MPQCALPPPDVWQPHARSGRVRRQAHASRVRPGGVPGTCRRRPTGSPADGAAGFDSRSGHHSTCAQTQTRTAAGCGAAEGRRDRRLELAQGQHVRHTDHGSGAPPGHRPARHAEFGTASRFKPAGEHARNRHLVTLESGTGSRCNPARLPKALWHSPQRGLGRAALVGLDFERVHMTAGADLMIAGLEGDGGRRVAVQAGATPARCRRWRTSGR